MLPSVPLAQLRRHNQEDDCWIAVDGLVYDVTDFLDVHPGGRRFVLELAGADATDEFFGLHRADVLRRYSRMVVGTLEGAASPTSGAGAQLSSVPYAEASDLQLGGDSPYYTDSHRAFLLAVRGFVDAEIAPDAAAMEEAGEIPSRELYAKMGQFGLLGCRMGPGPHLAMLPNGLPGGVRPDEFDHFHEMIATEEIAKIVCPSYIDGLATGLVIGLPALMVFGPPELAMRVGTECVMGEKIICLAVSEPQAGSDVAQLTTTATMSACGTHYVVNGLKKWITNGAFADYFVTAVRTGGSGMKGLSFLLIERGDGVETRRIKTAYGGSAGTAYVLFDECKVPVGNLIGAENDGFRCIMINFNHERWLICTGVIRACRTVIEECFKWCRQRKVFGKPLMEQPVIRAKLASMVAQTEAVHSWLERITHKMDTLPVEEQVKLAGPISLLKMQTTRVSLSVSDHACQIFGGRAITKTGMGQVVERFQRSIKFTAIYGGSEEIMADLAIRMADKQMQSISAKL